MYKNLYCYYFAMLGIVTFLFLFEASIVLAEVPPDDFAKEPLGALDQAIREKKQQNGNITTMPSVAAPVKAAKDNDFIPPPLPGQLQNMQNQSINSSPKAASKTSKAPLDLTNSKAFYKQKKKEEAMKKEVTVDQLLKLNYNIDKMPPMYYAKPFAKVNKHLPPVYYESYYTELAFKAVEQGDLNAIKYFIDKYDLSDKKNNDGDTMLIHAATMSKADVARLLLAKGVSVNEANNYKLTALHVAVMKNDYEMVKILLTMGADFTKKDENDKQPLDYALENQNDKIIELFKKYYEAVSRKKSEKLEVQKISIKK